MAGGSSESDEDGAWQTGGEKTLDRREFDMPHAGATLHISQGALSHTTWSTGAGTVVWEAADATVRHLDTSFAPNGLRGKRVVELGAGTGVCGIACAALGATVVLTDLPEVLPIAKSNAAASPWHERISVQPLNWADAAVPDALTCADLVVACDCIYQPAAYGALASVLAALSSPCLIAWRPRGKREADFLAQVTTAFALERVAHAQERETSLAWLRPVDANINSTW